MKILVVNGPNLNMLGRREPDKYGTLSLAMIESILFERADALGVELDVFQSNFEGEIVEKIQSASDFNGVIINAGAYTHTSVAIRDALLAVGVRFIEVHLSNVYAREPFRHKSMFADVAVGVISGLKEHSYIAALEYFASEI